MTYQSFIDLLPLTAAMLICLGMFLHGGFLFRIFSMIAAFLWLVHNIYVGSIGGSINRAILFFICMNTAYQVYRENKESGS